MPEHAEHKHQASKHEEKENSDNPDSKPPSWKYITIIILVIIGLFVAGMFGLKMAEKKTTDKNTVIYNNYKFKLLEDNAWYADLSIKGHPYTIPFYYPPDQVDYVDIQNESVLAVGLFSNEHPGGKVYMAIDPLERSTIVIAGVELARILGDKYDIYNFNVQSAFFLSPYENYTGTPIINCTNSSQDTMVILLAVGSKDRVRSAGNCILLESKDLNSSIKVADAFSYKLLRIIS